MRFLMLAGTIVLQHERAFLHDVAAIGEIAGIEQHGAARHFLGLGADREDAQRGTAEQRQRRHLFEKSDVVFERH
ncbi:hypothetical protein D3C85_1908990 [compost metagenome]